MKLIKYLIIITIFGQICHITYAAQWSDEHNGIKYALLEAKKNLLDLDNKIRLYQRGIDSAHKNIKENLTENNRKQIECRLTDLQNNLVKLIAQRNELAPFLNSQNSVLDVELDF